MERVEAILGVHGHAGRRPAARDRRRAALQRPDGGGRVRDRARRRAEHARAGQGRRDPARARRAAARPRPPCTWPCSTASSWPTIPLVDEDFESSRPAPAGAGPARPLLRADHHRRPGSARSGTSAGPTPATPRRAVQLRAAPGRGDVPRPPHSRDQLLGQVGRGDVDRDLADLNPRRARHEQQRRLVRRSRPGRSRTGRRQELLPRRDGRQPVLGRRPGAGRFRHHGRGLPPVHRRDRPGRVDQRRAGRTWTPTTCSGWPRSVSRSATAVVAAAVPGRSGGRHPGGVRQAGRGRRTSCPSRSGPARRPRTCPTPRSPGSRRRSSTSAASTPS